MRELHQKVMERANHTCEFCKVNKPEFINTIAILYKGIMLPNPHIMENTIALCDSCAVERNIEYSHQHCNKNLYDKIDSSAEKAYITSLGLYLEEVYADDFDPNDDIIEEMNR
jgi:hypothetical protein